MSQLFDMLDTEPTTEKPKGFLDSLCKFAAQNAIPLVGQFELTPRCTLDCSMCYVHLKESQMYRKEFTTEEWISLMAQAVDAGMMFATLTGGECLMRTDFSEIYDFLQSRGVLITILTNGTLIDEEMVAWLVKRQPRQVQISVYGSSPEGYARVTGNGAAFYKVDKTIDMLLAANVSLRLAVTCSKQMMPDFENILRYCNSKKEGITITTSFMFEAREETQREFKSFSPSLDAQIEYFKIRERVKNSGEKATVSGNETDLGYDQYNDYNLPEKGITCSAGIFGFSITWDGKMTPCSALEYVIKNPIVEGFLNSWRDINEKCRNYKNPTECIGCNYNQYCFHCAAAHYMKAGEGHANPDICAAGKRLVRDILKT